MKIPGEDWDSHKGDCAIQICSRCFKRIPQEDSHIDDCAFKLCGHCRTNVLPEHWDFHKDNCAFRRCHNCFKSLPSEHWDTHTVGCGLQYCYKCHKKIPKEQHKIHLDECQFKICYKCSRQVPSHQCRVHLTECTKHRCNSCGKKFEKGGWNSHICLSVCCWTCNKHIPTNDFPYHKQNCLAILHDRRSALKEDGYCIWLRTLSGKTCLKSLREGLLFCKEHADKPSDGKVNTAAEKQFYRRILLQNGGRPALWKTSSISTLAQKWNKSPKTVVICDIEAICTSYSISHIDVFEIAMMNAEGDWIIPPTAINHHLSKSDLLSRGSSYIPYKMLISRYYGEINKKEAKGISERNATWKEIGKQFQAYVKKHGKIDTWLEWSNNCIDYRGVYAGLTSIGYEHLLPPLPSLEFRPLPCFRKIKKALGLDGLSLAQGNLFEILYPEDCKLLSRAHRAGPDVQMLRKILQYLFNTLDGIALPGNIEKYFIIIDLDAVDNNEKNNNEL